MTLNPIFQNAPISINLFRLLTLLLLNWMKCQDQQVLQKRCQYHCYDCYNYSFKKTRLQPCCLRQGQVTAVILMSSALSLPLLYHNNIIGNNSFICEHVVLILTHFFLRSFCCYCCCYLWWSLQLFHTYLLMIFSHLTLAWRWPQPLTLCFQKHYSIRLLGIQFDRIKDPSTNSAICT